METDSELGSDCKGQAAMRWVLHGARTMHGRVLALFALGGTTGRDYNKLG